MYEKKNTIEDEIDNDIDLDDWFKLNSMTPIGEYENLSKRIRVKVKDIIASLKEKDEKELSDDRDEKDNLDELEGKEELDEDKKKEVKEKKKELGEEPEEEIKNKEQEKETVEENKEKDNKDKELKDDPYLAKVERLHQMRLRELKYELKKDDVAFDKHFVRMIYLQREVNKEKAAYIKEHDIKELSDLENSYLKEELKYEKTLSIRRERDITKLRDLDTKLDSIMDKMASLQYSLEKEQLTTEEYNEKINSLEDEKLETLYQINKLNPELLQEKQDRAKGMDDYERRKSRENPYVEKKIVSETNREKEQKLEDAEIGRYGKPKEVKQNTTATLQKDIDEKERRLDELRKHLKGIDITTSKGKKEAIDVISEIQTLESQKMSQEKQLNNLEENMAQGVTNYSDLEESEKNREENVQKMEEKDNNIDPNDISNDMMEQLRNAAISDPNTPEQAEEYLDKMQKVTEDVKKSSEEQEKQDDDIEPPSLWSKKKKQF